jgi:hypothetical protein
MGCDIHFIIEKQHKDFGWVGIMSTDDPFISYGGRIHIPIWRCKDRDYTFFACLAGVRGEGPNPKGWPEDASVMAQSLSVIDGEFHSYSYCSLIEFVIAKLKSRNELSPIAAEKLVGKADALHSYIGLYEGENLTDYRVIFWFDN